ncbi:MAG: PRC-barrel domain containing protein [Pedobacter sp.]|nr:MAG: PRC-barrel domain containing protein [Pedobacter sp.]
MENQEQYLEELSRSGYQIKGDAPDITGWAVKDESGMHIGSVTELLFDPRTSAVRYLIVDMYQNDMNVESKKVMIPLGIAHLHKSQDEVVLPGLHLDQYNLLPEYNVEKLGPDLEMLIRDVIGSPAALRLEDAMIEFDRNRFYDHHHFYKNQFFDRGEERKTIHELVEKIKNSK